jgi:GNAT superfamily N-acetyltransferase
METEGTEITELEYTAELFQPRHVDDLNRLIRQLSSTAEPRDEAWLREVLASPTRMFVALAGNRIVSTVLLVPTKILVGWKDWIEDVVTDEAFRGRGISGRLRRMAEAASAATPAKHVNLTSKRNSERDLARTMYARGGYELRETDVFRLTHNRPS